MKAAIGMLLDKKYNNYKFYVHNLAKFDGVFLMRILSEMGELNPVLNDSRIITKELLGKESKITFLDSYQMLPGSLRKLASTFGVESKGTFTYKFLVNTNNSLLYEGVVLFS